MFVKILQSWQVVTVSSIEGQTAVEVVVLAEVVTLEATVLLFHWNCDNKIHW